MDELQGPITSALAALITILTTYYAKLKKSFQRIDGVYSYLYGDHEKKGAITRLRELEGKVKDLEGVPAREAIDLNVITIKQQEAIKEALKPIFNIIEKKADKELVNIQLSHVMEAIERIGRGH